MKRYLSSLGIIFILSSVFVLGWSVGQPNPYKMDVKLIVKDKRFMACDFQIGQCAIFTVEQVQGLLLRANRYKKL